MTSPHLTKPRASALVDDLLAGLGSTRIDSKLQTQQGKLDVEVSSKAVELSKPWKTVKKVSIDSFARYGIDLGDDDEYAREQFITVTNHALETSGRKSEKLDEICKIVQIGVKPEQQKADAEPADPRDRLLSLQRSLLEAYSTPSFQKELHELSRLHGAPQKTTLEFKSAFARLVRSAQLPIISRFGFESSEKGVEDMLQAFRSYRDDADIYVNAAAIREALLLSPKQSEAEQRPLNEFPALLFSPKQSAAEQRPVNELFLDTDLVRRPRSKEEVMELLEDLLLGYSTAEFQERLKDLISLHSGGKHEAGGYYTLPGRVELAFEVQQHTLPNWGFDPSYKGVQDMILFCSKHLRGPQVTRFDLDWSYSVGHREVDKGNPVHCFVHCKGDSEVSDLFDAINSKLGMAAAACERFRKLASNLAHETP